MKARRIKGLLLDLDQKIENNKSIIQLFVRTEQGLEALEENDFAPYFLRYP